MYLGPCYIYYQYIPLYTTVLESWVVELPLPLATCCLIKQCGEMSLMLQLSLAQTYKCWCSIGWWYRTPSKLYDKFIIWGRTLEACTRAIASLPGMCLKWCPSITMLCIFIPPPCSLPAGHKCLTGSSSLNTGNTGHFILFFTLPVGWHVKNMLNGFSCFFLVQVELERTGVVSFRLPQNWSWDW